MSIMYSKIAWQVEIMKKADHAGTRFGKLTVLSRSDIRTARKKAEEEYFGSVLAEYAARKENTE